MSDQIACPLCAQSVAFTLIPHLRTEHKIEPEVFRVRFPEQPMCTAGFSEFLRDHQVRRYNGILHHRLDVAGCPMTARYGVDHPLIPEPDPTFVWTDPCRDVAEAIEHNERVFLYGPSGTGKSSLVRQIAAVVQRPVRRVSLNGETSVADFIGHWTVNGNKETVFVKGICRGRFLKGPAFSAAFRRRRWMKTSKKRHRVAGWVCHAADIGQHAPLVFVGRELASGLYENRSTVRDQASPQRCIDEVAQPSFLQTILFGEYLRSRFIDVIEDGFHHQAGLVRWNSLVGEEPPYMPPLALRSLQVGMKTVGGCLIDESQNRHGVIIVEVCNRGSGAITHEQVDAVGLLTLQVPHQYMISHRLLDGLGSTGGRVVRAVRMLDPREARLEDGQSVRHRPLHGKVSSEGAREGRRPQVLQPLECVSVTLSTGSVFSLWTRLGIVLQSG